MPSPTLNTLLLAAVVTLSIGSQAQTVFKCGNRYSQIPCSGGVAFEAADQRSGEQKLQTDAATRRDARIAQAMEHARLEQEARDLAANTPQAKPSALAQERVTPPGQATNRKNRSDHRRAPAPGRQKKAVKKDRLAL